MFSSSGFKFRIIIGLVIAGFYLLSYYSKTQLNPLTGENQQVSMSPAEEVAMGLQSAPEMAAEYGGLYPDNQIQQKAKEIGHSVVDAFNNEMNSKNISDPYTFDFHVLKDPETINAFALPGGQVFITYGLLSKLTKADELAGVLGHEVGHVVHRHSSAQMAKTEFIQGLAGAATAASGVYGAGQVAGYVAQIKLLKYSRNDESQADDFGVQYMIKAGYDPNAMIEVMEILKQSSGGSTDEFMSSHPSPENRIVKIKEEIAKYGNGKY